MKNRMILVAVLAAIFTASAHAQTKTFLNAVKLGGPLEVQAAISNGADVNERDTTGATPLMWACYLQYFEVVDILLKAGADVNAQDSNGFTALMWAAMNYEIPDKIIALLDAGADTRLKDKQGKTALDCAQFNWRFAGTEAYRRLEAAPR